jgi:hypothetical protein
LDTRGNHDETRIGGKLIRVADLLAEKGPLAGGGYVEKCHEAPGVWQMKADAGSRRGREFFAFDGQRVVLLHGAAKEARTPTPIGEYQVAMRYLDEYKRTGRVSPEGNDE